MWTVSPIYIWIWFAPIYIWVWFAHSRCPTSVRFCRDSILTERLAFKKLFLRCFHADDWLIMMKMTIINRKRKKKETFWWHIQPPHENDKSAEEEVESSSSSVKEISSSLASVHSSVDDLEDLEVRSSSSWIPSCHPTPPVFSSPSHPSRPSTAPRHHDWNHNFNQRCNIAMHVGVCKGLVCFQRWLFSCSGLHRDLSPPMNCPLLLGLYHHWWHFERPYVCSDNHLCVQFVHQFSKTKNFLHTTELFLHGYRPRRPGQMSGLYFPRETFSDEHFPGALQEPPFLPNYWPARCHPSHVFLSLNIFLTSANIVTFSQSCQFCQPIHFSSN